MLIDCDTWYVVYLQYGALTVGPMAFRHPSSRLLMMVHHPVTHIPS